MTDSPMTTEAVPTTGTAPADGAQADMGRWQRVAFSTIRGFLWGFAVLFSLRGLYLFGQIFGTFEWLINYRRRRRYRRRLKLLLGDALTPQQRRVEARRFFMRLRCDKIFYLIFDKIPREKALARFHYHGTELIDEALARGRGCFTAMSHHGSYHVGAMLMALRGYRIVAVRDQREGGMRKFIQEMYDRRYPEFQRMRVLYADTYPRDIYRAFGENYLVGAALDIHHSRGDQKRTVAVNILGQQRSFLAGTLQIALRSGAGVVQAFVISEKNFHYRLDILGPLVENPEGGETAEMLDSAMQAYARNIEKYTLRYPNHVSRV
ncbi:MAG TPA: lysophospholipid acyltransferase family protein [Phycisphaerae bacterium]|nr:lysophospholipid acyltransferase family protein [Phycisphaerae bacterium]